MSLVKRNGKIDDLVNEDGQLEITSRQIASILLDRYSRECIKHSTVVYPQRTRAGER